jgi:predicted Zn-dependent protease
MFSARHFRRSAATGLALLVAAELLIGGAYVSALRSSSPPRATSVSPTPSGPAAAPGGSSSARNRPRGSQTPAPGGGGPSTALGDISGPGLTGASPARRVTGTTVANRPGGHSPTGYGGAGRTAVSGSAATPQPVTCQTDLPLERSPDTGYDFLCQQGTTPVTWATDRLTVYVAGLSPSQSAAFTVAVLQWEAVARFEVTYTSSRRTADVTVTTATLSDGEAGYTEDGYTTVSYRCAPRCAYDHADVVLSSTVTLSQTDWMSTVLHELGHVAGLNHVSRVGEVMYPYLVENSPVLYTPGDRAGLAVLAAERS